MKYYKYWCKCLDKTCTKKYHKTRLDSSIQINENGGERDRKVMESYEVLKEYYRNIRG